MTDAVTRPDARALPTVIQGGMGVGISHWRLARATATAGALGVVSGVGIDLVLARRLQDGDADGELRAALDAYPDQDYAKRTWERFHRPDGRDGAAYRPVTRVDHTQRLDAVRLTALGAFVEVWLARRGHDGRVGINLLEKVQATTPAALLGAMLAGVDAVLIGAGVPAYVPAMLDELSLGHPVTMALDVHGGEQVGIDLDPAEVLGFEPPPLRRPAFLAIVATHVLAKYLTRDPATTPDGFVVEAPDAGGHNAPPRGKEVDALGQPVYGPVDVPKLDVLAGIGLPFWLAGGYGTPDRLRTALSLGAQGVQVGTAFALCDDSGMRADLRARVRAGLRDGSLEVRTDGRASPTGFPFKVAQLSGTVGVEGAYAREKRCDLGYLRTAFRREDGTIGYRCAAEPDAEYLRKGGDADDIAGRLCLCNGLAATAGLAQVRPDGRAELPIVTLGSDAPTVTALLERFPDGWSAADTVAWLMEGTG